MTSRFTDYEIRYTLDGKAKRFVQRDTHMSEADAWYYAALHSGIGVLYSGISPADKAAELRDYVMRHGLADVRFVALS